MEWLAQVASAMGSGGTVTSRRYVDPVTVVGGAGEISPLGMSPPRFSIAALLLPPYLLNQELAFDRLSRMGVAAIIMGWGAAMVLLVNVGLLFAPAIQEAAALMDSADVIGVYVQDPSSF